MATNKNLSPDELYLRTREDLLPFEDARFNSLLQSVANYYTTRNDQSTWGNFLRALAQELGQLDYGYSYDIVGKDPNFLTPPDMRRRWADPLYVSSNWPSKTQFDTDFKTMLIELIAAYRQGSTVQGIQDVIFAYTGINIQVQELYKQIGNGVFDQSDRNAIKVSVNVGNNSLSEITTLTQLQQIVNSLYGAIDLAKPAHVGLEFTTVFGEGDDIDCFISPAFVTGQQYATLTAAQQTLYSLNGYVLVNSPIFWQPSVSTSNPFTLYTLLRDRNGNLQLATTAGLPGTTEPTWNPTSGGLTMDGGITWTNVSPAVTNLSLTGNVLTVTAMNNFTLGQQLSLVNLVGTFSFLNGIKLSVLSSDGASFTAAYTNADISSAAQAQGTVSYNPAPKINILAYNGLSTLLKTLYQTQYANTNCTSTGIEDTLRIFIRQIEEPPQDPMLIQAPVLDPKNPTTTIAAWGLKMKATLTPAEVANLPVITFDVVNTVADGVNAGYTFSTLSGASDQSITHINIASNVLTVTVPNTYRTGDKIILLNISGASYLNGEILTVVTPAPSQFTAVFNHANDDQVASGTALRMVNLHEGQRVTITGCRTAFNITGKIRNVVMLTSTSGTFEIPLAQTVTSQAETGSGTITPRLADAYTLQAGQYVLSPDSNLPPVNDGTLNPPTKWIQVVDQATGLPTGEVANWDKTHQAGLVAPRLNQVWEISGGDESFIFGMS